MCIAAIQLEGATCTPKSWPAVCYNLAAELGHKLLADMGMHLLCPPDFDG